MWLKKLFGGNDEQPSEEQEDNSLETKINAALKKCESEKQAIETDVNNLRTWAADAIMEMYAEYIPGAKFSYQRDKMRGTVLQDYPQIKEKYAQQLGDEAADQCDKVVHGYLNQLQLLDSKVKLYDKLYQEHTQIKKKFEDYRERAKKMEKLADHSKRLEAIDNDVSRFSDTYSDSYNLEDIEKEVSLKAEYHKQMELLQMQYGSDSNFDNALAYKLEVDKMIDQ